MNEIDRPAVAYFSMEIALHPDMPTYSGGLGILAGDTLRAAADLGVSMIAVTLLQRQGYFVQSLDTSGWQYESPMPWNIEQYCRELPVRAEVTIEGRRVQLCAWKYEVTGCGGYVIPVFLLDTDLEENSDWDRTLTNNLYGGDSHYRLCQEVVLGIGGVRVLRALGYNDVARFHMNEGHAALLGLELLDESAKSAGRSTFNTEDVQTVRRNCIFTTHTPVPAGHDRFPIDQVQRTLGRSDLFDNHEVFCCAGELNMTYLALNLSHYVNGVTRFCASCYGLQKSESVAARYDSTEEFGGAGREFADCICWESPPTRRARQAVDSGDHAAEGHHTSRGEDCLPRKLRLGLGKIHNLRCRRLAQHTTATIGSFRYQWYESSPEWCPKPKYT